MTAKSALIIGSAGQDGRLLTAYLSSQSYRVVGVERSRITGLADRRGPIDLRDKAAISALVQETHPDEVYYLASHHEALSADATNEESLRATSQAVHCTGVSNVIGALETTNPNARLFYASSCRVFGQPKESPQSETTEIAPTDVFGQTKAEGMELVRAARSRKLFAASGILYNHESLWRDSRFVIPKIVKGAVDVKVGIAKTLILGDLRVRVDWGAAEDFIRAMHAMLQIDTPQDFVIGSGKLHSVGEAAELALKTLSLDPIECLRTDPSILRHPIPAVPYLANINAIQRATNWAPQISFERMVRTMLDFDRAERGMQAA